MADQNITELPVKTSSGMTSSDYMLGIDSAEGYQMLIKDLGDYIIRNVQVNTIAGANQTLKSALDTLNSKSFKSDLPSTSERNCDTLKQIGLHYAPAWTGTPSGVSQTGYLFCYPHETNANYIKQAYMPYDIDAMFIRTCNDGTWSTWTKIAFRKDSVEMIPSGYNNYFQLGYNTSASNQLAVKNTINGTVYNVPLDAQSQIDALNSNFDSLDTEMDSIRSAVGSPLKASTVADMTDTTKIYVYTGSETGYTAGNWYYYNGSAWISGGVYNSVAVNTDTTLLVSGAAADSKAVGDKFDVVDGKVTDLKSALTINEELYVETTSGKINESGTIGDAGSNQEVYTNLIPISVGQKIHFTATYLTTYTMWAYYATYDIDGVFIERTLISNSSAKKLDEIITIPSGASFIRLTFRTSGLSEYVISTYFNSDAINLRINDVFTDVKDTQRDVSKTSFRLYDALTIEDKYIRTSGTINTSATHSISDFIKVSEGDIINYALRGSNDGVGLINFYTTNIEYRNSVYSEPAINQNTTVEGTYTCPSDGYIRFCNRNDFLDGYAYFANKIGDNINYLEKKLESEIENININEYNIPVYWNDEIDDSIEKIRSNELVLGSNGVEFFFVTDTHWVDNAKRSGEILGYLSDKTRIKDVVFGGDAILSHNTTKAGAINEIRDFYDAYNKEFNLHTTLGNHDFNSNSNADSSTYLNENELYTMTMRFSEPYVNTEKTTKYGYWDNTSQKVRFIQFERYEGGTFNSEITSWVKSKIDELSEDWTVILFSHAYWAGAAGGNVTMLSGNDAFIESITADAQATIACWIVGHCHCDVSDNSLGVLAISTGCDIYTQSAQYGGPTMTLGTDTEQCIDCYQIDTKNRKIYITRIGAGSDREFSY